MANLKRGFNRVYIVLCAVWLLYSLVLYPQHQITEIGEYQRSMVQVCLDSHYNTSKELEQCEKTAEDGANAMAAPYTLPNWWLDPIVWLFVVVVLALMYALLWGVAWVGSWVAKGFRG